MKSRGWVLAIVLLSAAVPAVFAQDAWNHQNVSRFLVLPAFASQAVFDQETDLVWERTPNAGAFTWDQAQKRCNNLVLGGRMGWRLPAIQELSSILSIPNPPVNLEPGHPFGVVTGWLGQAIWSTTSSAAVPANAWTFNMAGNTAPMPKGSLSHCWCVRFRQGSDAQ